MPRNVKRDRGPVSKGEQDSVALRIATNTSWVWIEWLVDIGAEYNNPKICAQMESALKTVLPILS